MRILLCSLVVCFLATNAMNAFAQDKSPFEYENGAKPKKHSRVQPRVGLPPETVAKLIQQRAMRAAENRRARIESRNWAGVSLLRPHLRADLPPLVNNRAGWWWGTASARMQAFWSR